MLWFIQIVRRNGNTYSYEYNLKDHLGNNQATFYKNLVTNNVEVIQRDNYLAFGKQKSVTGGINNYLYNGKEKEEHLGDNYD